MGGWISIDVFTFGTPLFYKLLDDFGDSNAFDDVRSYLSRS